MNATRGLRVHLRLSHLSFASHPAPSARSISTGAPSRDAEDATTVIELPKGVLGGDELNETRVFGLDIGGTLTKLVYSFSNGGQSSLICRVWPTAEFEHKLIPALTRLVNDPDRQHEAHPVQLVTTGGGAYRFAPQLKHLLSKNIERGHAGTTSHDVPSNPEHVTNEDEMACLGAGLRFLQDHFSDEFFHCDGAALDTAGGVLLPQDPHHIGSVTTSSSARASLATQPILLANVGSGVSYLLCPPEPSRSMTDGSTDLNGLENKSSQIREPRRVGGTPLGGGTIFGMLRLVTGESGFGELLELAAAGDRTNVDMTVQDVYSKAYSNIGLSGDRAASILGGIGVGKNVNLGVTEKSDSRLIHGYTKADVARSVVFGICYNIGLMAVLQARLHNASNLICFTGNLVRGNEMIMADIDYGVRANSDDEMRAVFMRHGGSLGAIGAWVRGLQRARA